MKICKNSQLRLALSVLGLIVVVGACSPRAQTRGNLPDPELVAQLKVGDISRDEVAEVLGSPSSVTSFGDEVWFYISEKTETLAWLEPEIKTRQVLALHFGKDGILKKIETAGLDEAKKIVSSHYANLDLAINPSHINRQWRTRLKSDLEKEKGDKISEEFEMAKKRAAPPEVVEKYLNEIKTILNRGKDASMEEDSGEVASNL